MSYSSGTSSSSLPFYSERNKENQGGKSLYQRSSLSQYSTSAVNLEQSKDASDPFGGNTASTARWGAEMEPKREYKTSILSPAVERLARSTAYEPAPATERPYYRPGLYTYDHEPVKASTPAKPADLPPPKISLYDHRLSPESKYRGTTFNLEAEAPMRSVTQLGDDCEVTVFGYPPSAAQSVLEYFRQIGLVESNEIGEGNWMHLRYSSPWSANKAIGKNGRIFPGGTFMLAVIPAKEAKLRLTNARESFMTPMKGSSAASTRTQAAKEVKFSDPIAEERHIESSNIYKKEPSNEDVGNPLLSRLVKYVFGW